MPKISQYPDGSTPQSTDLFVVSRLGKNFRLLWSAIVTQVATSVANANDIFRCNSCGSSGWTGTINGAPAGAVVTYTNVSGNKNTLVPVSTSELGKQRLYNTTRGNYALISTSNGTSTITLTANAPANWINGDTITTISPTVISGLNNIDIEITSGEALNKNGVELFININDSAGTMILRVHPFEAYSASKQFQIFHQIAGTNISGFVAVKLTSNVFSFHWTASGAATANVTIRQAGYR